MISHRLTGTIWSIVQLVAQNLSNQFKYEIYKTQFSKTYLKNCTIAIWFSDTIAKESVANEKKGEDKLNDADRIIKIRKEYKWYP